MDMRTSVEIGQNGYLARLGRGSRSSYIRQVVDDHLCELWDGLELLSASRSDEEIVELCRAADAPPHDVAAAQLLDFLLVPEREAVLALAAEADATGLDVAEVMGLLLSGVGA